MPAASLHPLNLSKECMKTEAKQSWDNTGNKFRTYICPHTCSVTVSCLRNLSFLRRSRADELGVAGPSQQEEVPRKRFLPHISLGPVLEPNWDHPQEAPVTGPEPKVPPVQPRLPVVSHQAWTLFITIAHSHRCSAPLTIPLFSPHPSLSIILPGRTPDAQGHLGSEFQCGAERHRHHCRFWLEETPSRPLWRSVGKTSGFSEALVGIQKTSISCTTCLECVHGYWKILAGQGVPPQHLGGGQEHRSEGLRVPLLSAALMGMSAHILCSPLRSAPVGKYVWNQRRCFVWEEEKIKDYLT